MLAFISISLLCVMAGLSSCFPSPEQKLPIIVIPAREDTGGPMNMLAINIPFAPEGVDVDVQSRIDQINASGGMAVILYPDRFGFLNHVTLTEIDG